MLSSSFVYIEAMVTPNPSVRSRGRLSMSSRTAWKTRPHICTRRQKIWRRFGAVPADTEEADAFMSDLYVHLVEEAAVVLNHRIR